MKSFFKWLILFVIFTVITVWFAFLRGSGGMTRMTSVFGIYAVCQPRGYDVVCFGDTAGHDGGVSCVPLSMVGGKCH